MQNLVLKIKKIKKINKIKLILIIIILLVLLPVFLMWFKHFLTQQDVWCSSIHNTNLLPLSSPKTAGDYFNEGSYNFSTGNCGGAIIDYNVSIELDPTKAETYNDRAYTYMRMGDYKNALPDLDKAISLRPNYVNALMNRGDIYNYYLNDKTKAVNDYERVVAINGGEGTSACGHLLLARDNGWSIKTVFDVIFRLATHLNNIHQAGC